MKRFVLFLLSLIALPVQATWSYSWTDRTDQSGNPAGIFTTTPFPVDETMSTYSITNDEGTHIYNLGTVYFIDGMIDSTTATYLPSTRANTGGTFTAYKNISDALAAHSSDSPQNVTFLVRDGTYANEPQHTFVQHWGIDDTHRYSFIGYKQERPVIDGGSATDYFFVGEPSIGAQDHAYFTLQRLKVQNFILGGVYATSDFVPKITSKIVQYVSVIDVWFYQVAYTPDDFNGTAGAGSTGLVMTDSSSPGWTVNQWAGYYIVDVTQGIYVHQIASNTSNTITAVYDADHPLSWAPGDVYYVCHLSNNALYFLNADHGWIYHCTVDRSKAHSIKIGDGTSYTICEWTVSSHAGYWSGKTPAFYMSRAVGLDLPNDPNEGSTGNIVRYNIISDCISQGIAVRRSNGFSIHHNEVSGWGYMNALGGYTGGDTTNGIYIYSDAEGCSGSIYSNVVHDPAPGSIGMMVFCGNGAGTVNIFNNLFYWSSNNTSGFHTYDSGTAAAHFYNNTLVGTTTGYIVFPFGTSAEVMNGNICVQLSTGTIFNASEGPTGTHTYNLLYYPNGGIGDTYPGPDPTDIAGSTSEFDPKFVMTPSGIYVWGMGNIQTSSPAKDAFPTASAPTGTFTIDFTGNSRPQGSAWDMGAYEYVSIASITPARTRRGAAAFFP